jgi:hypothetical protein
MAMTKTILDAWRQTIIDEMAKELPQFSLLKGRERGEERNLLKFAWVPESSSLTCGIAFRPIDDGFDAWVGWSANGRFPYMAAQADPESGDLLDVTCPAIMVPSIVLSGRHGSAAWMLWEPADAEIDDPIAFAKAYSAYAMKVFSAQEAIDLVLPLVQSAMAEVRDCGLPYLRKRIAMDRAT